MAANSSSIFSRIWKRFTRYLAVSLLRCNSIHLFTLWRRRGIAVAKNSWQRMSAGFK